VKISAADAAGAIPENPIGLTRRRLTDEHELDIYLVNDPVSQIVALEIHLIPNGVRLPDVEVGDVLEISFQEQSGVIRIGLLNITYADVFYVLVDDLVKTIVFYPGLEPGAKAAMLRLRRWERLLQASSKGMSSAAQKGLIGELLVLSSAAKAIGISNALNAWKGPAGGTRDFDLGGTGIEVKTTAGKGLLTVRISSERQLEVIAVESLFLWCISLEKSEIGDTLNDAVDRVITLIGNDEELVTIFKEKLMLVGYILSDRDIYMTKFIVRAEYVYEIREGFPRITSDVVPNCVFDVGYSIDLEACEEWLSDPATIWKNILGG